MSRAHEVLKETFGYDSFRGDQEAVISSVLDGSDTMVIMPTGAGKSICYQVPALVLSGLTVVISPLLALMQDQVDSLFSAGVSAAALNSLNTDKENQEILESLKSGSTKILYISPEKALSNFFLEFVSKLNVSLFAIDEAHCVSIWGNDFRQEYTQLNRLMDKVPSAVRMGLTATADNATQIEMAEKLSLRDLNQFISSFERTNININVQPAAKRVDTIIDYVKAHDQQAGIIYCLSRKSTENLAQKLVDKGIKATYFHADLSPQKKKSIQRAFQQDEISVICATIAFGMGIDKPNIRYVIHHNLPKNLESYYQEIGRAGRDGENAQSLLFFSLGDAKILRQFVDQSEANDTFKNVQITKLNRMVQFAQATSCRTNMILAYFGEHRVKACGHCDNCIHPPESFDGTVIGQKILSAIVRLKESVAINMLTNVLRGSDQNDLLQRGFHQIKTYGALKEKSREDVLDYISQLINQGFIDVDFTDYNKLKCTTIGNKVLFEGQSLQLTKPQIKELKAKEPSKTESLESALFERLRALRLRLAKEANVPAYAIFNDATLEEMSRVRPLFEGDMSEISGIGSHKLKQYGQVFLEEIKAYCTTQNHTKNVKGKTYLETLSLIKEEKSISQMAKERALSEDTILSHIAHLYEKEAIIDISGFISNEEINEITPTWYQLKKPEQTKPVHEALNGKFSHGKIRLTIAFLTK